ncbi:MAG: hypothetical protein A3B37_03235 [Candidatus Sungbacteria bacterium RIFCSPLOWO2_01_FULL_59_16]|uniref:Uncharacterized protein n=1 Tax=Candidatus Sungbacteria bacterium RIFCSPLOWO2_01_FULL_59_16 TaxID=1802280 RepID=A0A1G2LBL0_9BACT|nr:MAG: hypothetical protein A3B37_03235 [Candidatus Sungbacteria bacterium RIFCSPLOWO2_01_FULL_59_16]
MPDQAQMVSFDGLRALLEKGCAALLACIPEGSEPVINLAVLADAEGVIRMEVDDPNAQLDLLVDFAKAVRLLAMGRLPQEVRRLMADEGLSSTSTDRLVEQSSVLHRARTRSVVFIFADTEFTSLILRPYLHLFS